MKKIIRLKGELLLAIVIAIVFGMAISLVGTSIYRKIILNPKVEQRRTFRENLAWPINPTACQKCIEV